MRAPHHTPHTTHATRKTGGAALWARQASAHALRRDDHHDRLVPPVSALQYCVMKCIKHMCLLNWQLIERLLIEGTCSPKTILSCGPGFQCTPLANAQGLPQQRYAGKDFQGTGRQPARQHTVCTPQHTQHTQFDTHHGTRSLAGTASVRRCWASCTRDWAATCTASR